MTNWEYYFGSPIKASESISRMVDHYDLQFRDQAGMKTSEEQRRTYQSEFMDNFKVGGRCEYGLIHQDTLTIWLEAEYESADK